MAEEPSVWRLFKQQGAAQRRLSINQDSGGLLACLCELSGGEEENERDKLRGVSPPLLFTLSRPVIRFICNKEFAEQPAPTGWTVQDCTQPPPPLGDLHAPLMS